MERQKEIVVYQINKIIEENEDNDNEMDNEKEEQLSALRSMEKNINTAITAAGKKNNIVWPSSTRNGEHRTAAKMTDISDRLQQGEVLSIDEAKGIVDRSLFLDIPSFNYIRDIPAEYLHSTCLGTAKKMTELTFSVGDNRERITKRKLSSPAQYNALIALIKDPREFSRRARSLDFSVMKGQEFRNITLFYWPIVIECIEPNAKERRLWLLFSYMIKASVIPSKEFVNSNLLPVIEYCSKHFYTLYEKLFGCQNCTYNTHIVGCHLKDIRVHGPLTFKSAFSFESFYGEMRHCFTPGTTSPLKQILQKVLLKRAIGPHCCETSIFLCPKDTPLECNSQIYTFIDNQYKFYQIVSINENDSLECCEIGKYSVRFPETPTLNWDKIGVFSAGGVSDELETIELNDVDGKIIRVQDLFITCPTNILQEK